MEVSRPTIRETIPGDARAIAEVHVRAWQHAYRGQMPDDFLGRLSVDEREAMWRSGLTDPRPGRGCFVAEDQHGRIVGFGPTSDEGATEVTGEVHAIYLEPEAVGTGVGRELFALASAELRERGFRAATLWVLQTNERARRFYERAGWRLDGAVSTERVDCANLPTVRYRAELA